MSVIRWEDPPPHGNSKPKPAYKYQSVVDDLRANPGEWAVVLEDVTTGTAGAMVHRIKNGWTCFLPGGAFEAVCRNGERAGRSRVYARYVGDLL